VYGIGGGADGGVEGELARGLQEEQRDDAGGGAGEVEALAAGIRLVDQEVFEAPVAQCAEAGGRKGEGGAVVALRAQFLGVGAGLGQVEGALEGAGERAGGGGVGVAEGEGGAEEGG